MDLIRFYKLVQVNYKSHKTLFDALIRSIINLFLVLVDLFPGITLITDISETINFITRVSTRLGYKLPELTPNVPTLLLGGSVISNPILEILTFGVFPTYTIPALFQFVNDFKLLKEIVIEINELRKNPSKFNELLKSANIVHLNKVNISNITDAEIIEK